MLLIGNDKGDVTDLSPLSSIKNVGSLYIKDIKYSIRIEGNSGFTNLIGLPDIDSLEHDLEIRDNNQLLSLEGLPSISYIGDDLKISDNTYIVNLDGLSTIETINGTISIINNNRLINIDALSSITSIESLFIHFNDRLPNLYGLEQIIEVGGFVRISKNYILKKYKWINQSWSN